MNQLKNNFFLSIGPEKSMLIVYNNQTKTIKPSQFFKDARELGLFFHPYTFRIDSLPVYSDSYTQLLKIFIDDLRIEGLFTDFSDLTLQYIRNSSSVILLNINIILFCSVFFILRLF